MPSTLKEHSTVYVHPSGGLCTVVNLLGEGGQGTVYRATWSSKPVALKWYLPEFLQSSPDQRFRLDNLIRKKKPSEAFLWPLAIVEAEGIPGFGYLMPLRQARFKTIPDLLFRNINATFRVLTLVGLQLARQYQELHGQGYCYGDINMGNAAFDPQTGDIAICDNDNAVPDDLGKPWTGVLGTPKFMAPEIVRGETLPRTATDLHSLAVLLFYIFCNHHPLEGKRVLSIPIMDPQAGIRIYGQEPVFIFDPQDRSNEALPREKDPTPQGLAGATALALWSLYPQFLRDLFTQAFTVGLRDSHQRVVESVWQKAFARLGDVLMYCRCAAENFYDGEALKATGGKAPHCWACQREIPLPFRIRLGKDTVVMLNHDSRLYPHHTKRIQTSGYDFSHSVAQVVRNPSDQRIWGLKNLSQDKWMVTLADKPTREVLPGQSVTLTVGTRINFGQTEGEIHA